MKFDKKVFFLSIIIFRIKWLVLSGYLLVAIWTALVRCLHRTYFFYS